MAGPLAQYTRDANGYYCATVHGTEIVAPTLKAFNAQVWVAKLKHAERRKAREAKLRKPGAVR